MLYYKKIFLHFGNPDIHRDKGSLSLFRLRRISLCSTLSLIVMLNPQRVMPKVMLNLFQHLIFRHLIFFFGAGLFQHLLFQHSVFSQELSEPLNSTSVLSGADTVSPLPTASFTVTNNETCMGTSTPFIFTNQSANANSYTWDFGDNTGIFIGDPITHIYTSNGTFNISLTLSFGTSTLPPVSQQVTLSPTAPNISGPNPICINTIPPPVYSTLAGFTSYSWTVTGGTIRVVAKLANVC